MANPQLEHGYTQIANEIIEHLMKLHLSSNQWQVLLCIIRKTYGFQKKVDFIANSQIVEATALCKSVVSRSLRVLLSINVIERKGKFIGFQKDWEIWHKLAIPSTFNVKLAEQSTNVDQTDNKIDDEKLAIPSTKLAIPSTKVSSPRITQKKKETYTKEILKKPYGEFQNVLLTDDELSKLQRRFPSGDAEQKIENLSEAFASKGYKRDSHYATILNWARRDDKTGQQKRGESHVSIANW